MSAPDPAVPDLDARFDGEYLHFYPMMQTPSAASATPTWSRGWGRSPPALDVLDAPCRWGRIANRLAARGCRVTGLHASRLFLEPARRDVAETGVAVEHVAGDMRALPWTERFDRLVCWFLSFDFDDETDRRVLPAFRRALRPSGRLLETFNLVVQVHRLPAPPTASATTGTAMGLPVHLGEESLGARSRFNSLTSRVENERIVSRNGRIRRHAFSVRLFTVPELRDWLLQAGFAPGEYYGADGGPPTLHGLSMPVVACA